VAGGDPEGAAVTRGLALALVLAAVAAIGAAGAGAQQAPATFRSRVDVVPVNVSVMKGREPVTGLAATEFELTDNGVKQTVDAVSLEHVPIDLTLVITGYDKSRSNDHLRGLVSAETTRRLLLPQDRLRLVVVNDDVHGKLVGPDFAVPTEHTTFEQIPGIALMDGLFYALAWPVDPDRRHLVVAFTDGMDDWSTLEPDRLPKLAGHSDAVMHAVFWATPDSAPPSTAAASDQRPTASFQRNEWEASYRVVDAAVQRTGGTIQTTSKGPEALASIIADFRSSYVLRFTPRGVTAGGWHELRVKVTRPGSFAVRARKGYEG
jgi:hypothetical protein